MDKTGTVFKRLVLAILFYAFLIWAADASGLFYVVLVSQLHSFALAFIITAPASLIVYALACKYVIKKSLITLHFTKYDKGLAHYFIYGFMLISIVVSFYVGAWYSNSGLFVSPITKQGWQYDQCAFENGAGGSTNSFKTWECVQPNGKIIKHP